MAPLDETATEQMQDAGVPLAVIHKIGDCVEALRQLKREDAVWATNVLHAVLQDNVRMLQAVEAQLARQLHGCTVGRTPPADERRELLHMLTDACRAIPQGSAFVSQHRLEMAWLEPGTLRRDVPAPDPLQGTD